MALVLLLVDHLAHGGVETIQGALVGALAAIGETHVSLGSHRAPLALNRAHLDHLLLVLLLLQEPGSLDVLESLAPGCQVLRRALVLIDLWVWIPLALAHLSGEMLLLLELFSQELLLLLLLSLFSEELLLLLLHHVHLYPLLLLHCHHLFHHGSLLLVAHIARRGT